MCWDVVVPLPSLFCLFSSSVGCFLFIGVQSTPPSIQAGLLTSTSFLCWVLFLYSQSCHFSIDSYSPKLFLPPKNFPLLLFLSFMSVASFEIFNKKKKENSRRKLVVARQGARKLVKSHLHKMSKVCRVPSLSLGGEWVSSKSSARRAFQMWVQQPLARSHGCFLSIWSWASPLGVVVFCFPFVLLPTLSPSAPACLPARPVTFCIECIHWYSHLFPGTRLCG